MLQVHGDIVIKLNVLESPGPVAIAWTYLLGICVAKLNLRILQKIQIASTWCSHRIGGLRRGEYLPAVPKCLISIRNILSRIMAQRIRKQRMSSVINNWDCSECFPFQFRL